MVIEHRKKKLKDRSRNELSKFFRAKTGSKYVTEFRKHSNPLKWSRTVGGGNEIYDRKMESPIAHSIRVKLRSDRVMYYKIFIIEEQNKTIKSLFFKQIFFCFDLTILYQNSLRRILFICIKNI